MTVEPSDTGHPLRNQPSQDTQAASLPLDALQNVVNSSGRREADHGC